MPKQATNPINALQATPNGPAPLALETNLKDVMSLLPEGTRQSIDEILFEEEGLGLFNVDERDLYAKIRETVGRVPSPTDNRLRLRFWDEYQRAMTQAPARGDKPQMVVANIIAGICTKDYFSKYYLKNKYKVAWLLCPPVGYTTKMAETLEFGIDQLRDILEQPHQIGSKIDTKLAELKVKITLAVMAQLKGSAVQRSLQVQVPVGNPSDPKLAALTQDGATGTLEKELEILRQRERASRNLPPMVDATKGQMDVIDVEPSE